MRQAYANLPVKHKNWVQIIGYSLGSVILAALITLAVFYLATDKKTLKLAVGPADGIHAKFAAKLADVVRANSRMIRIAVVPYASQSEALGALNRGDADLALARTDQHMPSSARSIAELETDIVFVATPKSQTLSTLASLRGRRVAIVGADAQDEALVKRVLDGFDLGGAYTAQLVPPDTALDKLFQPPAYRAAIEVASISKLQALSRRPASAKPPQNIEIGGVDGGKGLEHKIPGVFADTIEAGVISSSPRWPADDTDSLLMKHLLLARAKMQSRYATELASIVLENKEDLALDNEFATKIEPPDTDKSAFVLAHPGAGDYVDNDVKTFMDKYSDFFYIGTSIAGGIGTVCVMLYSILTKVHPVPASDMLGELSEISARAREAPTHAALNVAHGELEELLGQTLGSLYNKTMSSEGLDAFRLAYEAAHRAIDKRHRVLAEADNAGQPAPPPDIAPPAPADAPPDSPASAPIEFAARASRI